MAANPPQSHTPSNSRTQPWTTRRLLAWTAEHFEAKGIDSPRLSAEMLMAHVLEVERLKLFMEPDRPASDLERAAFRDLVERAVAHEPVDYLVGHAPFFTLKFKVTRATLIPRPSTETLVEHVIQHARVTPGFRTPLIADVGTGSGCIAISLAKHLTEARVVATDISAEALAVAQENAATHGVADRIDFIQGDLLEPVIQTGHRFDYLCSNPPYIPDDEWDDVAPNVKDHEPTTALRGGHDGLVYLRPIIEGAADLIRPGGQLVLEHATVHGAVLPPLIEQTQGLADPRVLKDHEALPRILVAVRD